LPPRPIGSSFLTFLLFTPFFWTFDAPPTIIALRVRASVLPQATGWSGRHPFGLSASAEIERPRVRRIPIGLLFALLLAAIVLALIFCRASGAPLNHRQIESLTIFCALILGILLYEDHRLAISLFAGVSILVLGLLSLDQFISAAALDVILFLAGTFLVAGYLEQSLFFEHVASQIVRRCGPRPELLLAVLMLSAMIASAIVGEVAAILFVGGAMLHIAQRYKLKPIPFLMMLVFATNTGSAASAFSPVGVTIALKAHLTVLDFFRWATPIALAVLALVFAICRWWFARDWKAFAAAVHEEHSRPIIPDPSHGLSAVPGWSLIAAMTILFVFHAQIEQALNLSPNVVLLATSLGAGATALLLSGPGARELIDQRVDWSTLIFFLMLFVVVGALESTGVTSVVAQGLKRTAGPHPAALVLAVGWSTGILSALLANMLAVAAFLPVIADLNAHGANCPPAIYWLMLFGATFMGNMTSIGSTCNIIACGMAYRNTKETIYFVPWLKIGLIISLASMILATLLLAIQTAGLSRG
jgi:Na+/H+ antiporter NhaD/arsenite permease-like protein